MNLLSNYTTVVYKLNFIPTYRLSELIFVSSYGINSSLHMKLSLYHLTIAHQLTVHINLLYQPTFAYKLLSYYVTLSIQRYQFFIYLVTLSYHKNNLPQLFNSNKRYLLLISYYFMCHFRLQWWFRGVNESWWYIFWKSVHIRISRLR